MDAPRVRPALAGMGEGVSDIVLRRNKQGLHGRSPAPLAAA